MSFCTPVGYIITLYKCYKLEQSGPSTARQFVSVNACSLFVSLSSWSTFVHHLQIAIRIWLESGNFYDFSLYIRTKVVENYHRRLSATLKALPHLRFESMTNELLIEIFYLLGRADGFPSHVILYSEVVLQEKLGIFRQISLNSI